MAQIPLSMRPQSTQIDPATGMPTANSPNSYNFGAPADNPKDQATTQLAYGGRDEAVDSNANTYGNLLGISQYNNVPIPVYNDPYDVAGYQNSKYYQLANSNSMTPWAKQAGYQQNTLASQAGNNAKAAANGQAGQSASRLAMQGGLTSGARERVSMQAGKNALSMINGANQTSANNQASIGMQDAQQRQKMLGDATTQLMSMKTGNVQGQNAYNQNIADMMGQIVGGNNNSLTTMATS